MKRNSFLCCICLSLLAHIFTAQAAPKDLVSPSQAKTIIAHRAEKVLLALKTKDMARLATFVHPEKGLRFSPYEYVNMGADLVFRRNQLQSLWASKKLHAWGEYDGSGAPIQLTFRAYYQGFVYDHDYAKAKHVGFNSEIMGHGNMRNNIREVYRRAIVVEYHFAGFDPQRKGMDWKSLWLVFEKKNQMWYLVGIVHGEWTI